MNELPKFRVVHYIANPLAGLRFPVAAVVRHSSGKTDVLVAERVPGPDCLGSNRAHQHISLLQPHLDRIESFDELPPFLGPHFAYADPQEIPTHEKWKAWVQGAVFPPVEKEGGERRKYPVQRRSKFARTWLERQGVSEPVEDNYQMDSASGQYLESITHWAALPSQTLLMEPLTPARGLKLAEKDLRKTVLRLRAFHDIVGDTEEFILSTYLLQGFSNEFKTSTRQALRGVAQVFDLDDRKSEHELVSLLRSAARQQTAEV